MSVAWTVVQILYAAGAWGLALRSVYHAARLRGLLGERLVEALLKLRSRGDYEAGQLAALLREPALSALEDAAEQSAPELLVSRAQSLLGLAAPPMRLLRTLATVGTSLGFLGAVITLHGAIQGPMTSAGVGALTVARAFDSAVLGFVTGLPCWGALLVCRREHQTLRRALERCTLLLGVRRDAQG